MRFPRYLAKDQELRNKVALEAYALMFEKLFNQVKHADTQEEVANCRKVMLSGAFSLADEFIKESKK